MARPGSEIPRAPYPEALDLPDLPVEERCLTEVDNLDQNRDANGNISQFASVEVFKNLVSAVKEAAMPYAVTTTEHRYEPTGEFDTAGRVIRAYHWLGKKAVHHAMSGFRFHKAAAALERVPIEVDEAQDAEANLRPGVTKIFLSPRMTRADATYAEAKEEHLADEDAVRISDVVTDSEGNIQKRRLQSLLVRDIPLQAWVGLLEDPNNMFGKSIAVEHDGSALSVMKVHRELEVPAGTLKEGVISVIEAVIPYIEGAALRASVEMQLERFRQNQGDMDAKASNIAKRWQDFEVALADSLHVEQATQPIRAFIVSLQDKWSQKDLAVIKDHQLRNAEFRMSRQLAVIVEQAQQNMLWTRAAVVTSNEAVLTQLDRPTARRIHDAEMVIQMAYDSGYTAEEVKRLEAQGNRIIADNNVKVGGGCAGVNNAKFGDQSSDDPSQNGEKPLGDRERKIGKEKMGLCQIKSCPTRPREVKVGGCDVCIDRCQKLFDAGQDPTTMGSAPERTSSLRENNIAIVANLLARLREGAQVSDKESPSDAMKRSVNEQAQEAEARSPSGQKSSAFTLQDTKKVVALAA